MVVKRHRKEPTSSTKKSALEKWPGVLVTIQTIWPRQTDQLVSYVMGLRKIPVPRDIDEELTFLIVIRGTK